MGSTFRLNALWWFLDWWSSRCIIYRLESGRLRAQLYVYKFDHICIRIFITTHTILWQSVNSLSLGSFTKIPWRRSSTKDSHSHISKNIVSGVRQRWVKDLLSGPGDFIDSSCFSFLQTFDSIYCFCFGWGLILIGFSSCVSTMPTRRIFRTSWRLGKMKTGICVMCGSSVGRFKRSGTDRTLRSLSLYKVLESPQTEIHNPNNNVYVHLILQFAIYGFM